MQTNCVHEWKVVATFETRGCQVRECTVCEQTSTTWVIDDPQLGIAAGSEIYLVPVDPMDAIDTECCQ